VRYELNLETQFRLLFVFTGLRLSLEGNQKVITFLRLGYTATFRSPYGCSLRRNQ